MGGRKVVVKLSTIDAPLVCVFVVIFASTQFLGFANTQRPDDIRIRDGNQRAILFSGLEGAGQYLSLAQGNWQNLSMSITMPNSDLNYVNFNNMAHSACVSGIRIFYENPNFNEERGLAEYIYGPGNGNKCVNLKYVGGKVRSSRLAGLASDYKASTLTLYEGDYFQGQDEFTVDDRARLVNLDRRASSLIVTGRSPWSLYSLPNFHGDVACVTPKYPAPAFVFDLMSVGVPEGSIRSVRRGCLSKEGQMGQNDSLPAENPGSNTDSGEGQGSIRSQRPGPSEGQSSIRDQRPGVGESQSSDRGQRPRPSEGQSSIRGQRPDLREGQGYIRGPRPDLGEGEGYIRGQRPDPGEVQSSIRSQRPDLRGSQGSIRGQSQDDYEGQGSIRGQRPAPMRPHAESMYRPRPTTEYTVHITEVISGSRRISDNLV